MTRQIVVGNVPIGGGAPVVIQSMLNTKTTDVAASLNQICALKKPAAKLRGFPCRIWKRQGLSLRFARKVNCR